jgi:hypothetical protein
LAQHPYNKIRQLVGQRAARERKDLVYAPRGAYELVRIPGGKSGEPMENFPPGIRTSS